MPQVYKEPKSIEDLQDSYDQLFDGWMGKHKNVDQARCILDLLGVESGKRLGDIGCGLGYVLNMADKRGVKSCGVDISQVALSKALKENTPSPQVALAAAEKLPWRSNSMDYVVILGSLEHFLNPPQSIQETARVLKSAGKAALLVPNSHHIRAIYNVYKYGEILPELQDFERFGTRVEWERMLKDNGLQIQSVHKYDTGMARIHKEGRDVFWYLYNILFRLFGNRWIPLNLTYTFIFICTCKKDKND